MLWIVLTETPYLVYKALYGQDAEDVFFARSTS